MSKKQKYAGEQQPKQEFIFQKKNSVQNISPSQTIAAQPYIYLDGIALTNSVGIFNSEVMEKILVATD